MTVMMNDVPKRSSRRRKDGPCRGDAGCTRHDWLVTTSNEHPNTWPRKPWGTVHVKGNGQHLTACGLYAVGWHVFFEHAFRVQAPEACPTCARAVMQSPGAAHLQAGSCA